MAMDLSRLRKLLALDASDPLSRFALGKKLFEEGGTPEALAEAAEHLRFANARAPDHLATYHILGQTLIRLGRGEEAKQVLREGVRRVAAVGHGMGRDLGPAMEALLEGM
jgi:cytochrome c-type biogenesis protein CcmH/NrfG